MSGLDLVWGWPQVAVLVFMAADFAVLAARVAPGVDRPAEAAVALAVRAGFYGTLWAGGFWTGGPGT